MGNDIAAHSLSVLVTDKFVEWMKANKPEQWAWAKEHQHDMGKIAGASVGGMIDRDLSAEDRKRLQTATQTALESGAPGIATKWRNNSSGAYGSVTPQPIFPMNGTSCREFQQHINAGGEMATGYGTACRDRKGIWRIAENG